MKEKKEVLTELKKTKTKRDCRCSFFRNENKKEKSVERFLFCFLLFIFIVE